MASLGPKVAMAVARRQEAERVKQVRMEAAKAEKARVEALELEELLRLSGEFPDSLLFFPNRPSSPSPSPMIAPSLLLVSSSNLFSQSLLLFVFISRSASCHLDFSFHACMPHRRFIMSLSSSSLIVALPHHHSPSPPPALIALAHRRPSSSSLTLTTAHPHRRPPSSASSPVSIFPYFPLLSLSFAFIVVLSLSSSIIVILHWHGSSSSSSLIIVLHCYEPSSSAPLIIAIHYTIAFCDIIASIKSSSLSLSCTMSGH